MNGVGEFKNPTPFVLSYRMVELSPIESIRRKSVGIIGAGAAGLITGHTLLQDGFKNVQLLTRDKSVGGVWARERIYPGVSINK